MELLSYCFPMIFFVAALAIVSASASYGSSTAA
jgi:hypothetical protein